MNKPLLSYPNEFQLKPGVFFVQDDNAHAGTISVADKFQQSEQVLQGDLTFKEINVL